MDNLPTRFRRIGVLQGFGVSAYRRITRFRRIGVSAYYRVSAYRRITGFRRIGVSAYYRVSAYRRIGVLQGFGVSAYRRITGFRRIGVSAYYRVSAYRRIGVITLKDLDSKHAGIYDIRIILQTKGGITQTDSVEHKIANFFWGSKDSTKDFERYLQYLAMKRNSRCG